MDSPQPNPLKPGPIEPREIYQVFQMVRSRNRKEKEKNENARAG